MIFWMWWLPFAMIGTPFLPMKCAEDFDRKKANLAPRARDALV